ncbi:acetyltransferase [Thiomicrorhabdus sediminis]|uniref:Acetyltransferase n=1 Tax=Thiomicrorhabdus sediminis TaxID=2580412 RepID=A0A4P9K657_9GAMM|nr:acetyltransferase [Thiomicrorhabdus sediminis]QCU90479.1 acetyltransferase [Thiomicrorhabdus sediminis]
MSVHIDSKIPLLLIGGGGHCESVIDVIKKNNHFHIVGIVESDDSNIAEVNGIPVIGRDKDLPALIKTTRNCVVTIGQVGLDSVRQNLFAKVKSLGGILPVISSPLAHIAESACIGEGTVIMHHALVNSGAVIGRNCIVNSKALVEHHTKIGDFCHIATAAVINGDCDIGNNCFIGSSATIKQGVAISSETVIGAASYVHQSTQESGTYFGSPAMLRGNA